MATRSLHCSWNIHGGPRCSQTAPATRRDCVFIICHMSVTMTLTNQIDGWTLRDSAISHYTLELWTGTCFASTESADSSHVRLQISAIGLIFAISHDWKFLSFFRVKKLPLRVLFFRAFPVRVEYRFHDDKHNLSWLLGQFGCISARHGSPRAAVAGRGLTILPRLPGEIVYCKSRLFRTHVIFVYFVRAARHWYNVLFISAYYSFHYAVFLLKLC